MMSKSTNYRRPKRKRIQNLNAYKESNPNFVAVKKGEQLQHVVKLKLDKFIQEGWAIVNLQTT